MVDRLGYLWLCTPKGVVKYNGYEERLINSLDVWKLYEDSKGRLWECTISDQLCYLKNDKHYNIPIKGISRNIRPSYICEYPFGLFIGADYWKNLFVERNGIAQKYEMIHPDHDALLLYHTDSTFIFVDRGDIFKIDLIRMVVKKVGRLNMSLTERTISTCKEYLFIYSFEKGLIYTHNMNTHQADSFEIFTDKGEYIYTVNHHKDAWSIITNKNYHTMTGSVGIVSKVPYRQLMPPAAAAKSLLSFILNDSLWGTVITTSSNGAFLNLNPINFRFLKDTLHEATYMGKSGNVDGYWSDNVNQQLICVRDGKASYYSMQNTRNIAKLIPCAPGLLFMFTNNSFFWLPEKTFRPVSLGFNKYPLYTPGIRDCYLQDTNTLFVLSVDGLSKISIHKNASRKKIIDSGSYQSMTFDPLAKQLVLYDERKLLIYDIKSGRKHQINRISSVVPKLENIVFDTSGNVFVKSADELFLYSRRSGMLRPFFSNIRLDDAHLSIYNNWLVVAGKFGIAVCRIAGIDSISATFVYRNTKSVCYDHIFGLQTSADGILLNTDKGAITLSYPSDYKAGIRQTSSREKSYRLIVAYGDTAVAIHPSDTLYLSQPATRLLLDVVNPLGIGKLFFFSSFGNASDQTRLPSNEIQLSGLVPGRFYDLYVTAKDDLWKSDPLALKIFIVPYWYQTGMSRGVFIAGCIILIAMLVGITYHVTRRAADRQNWKKNVLLEFNNLRLDFELKSIYNQINPHFIFNTLNTSLYFIQKKKLDEAHRHISAFSDLLRSYLASSKNKFIRLSDEIENLENYITLQQARFEDRFTYRINIDTGLHLQSIQVPPFLLQPLIENAVTHGLLPKEDGTGNLEISFKIGTEKSILVCIIDDNGIGREKAERYKKESRARIHGNELIGELIDYYKKYEQTYIHIEYIDKPYPQSGTTLIITFKNLKNEGEVHLHHSG